MGGLGWLYRAFLHFPFCILHSRLTTRERAFEELGIHGHFRGFWRVTETIVTFFEESSVMVLTTDQALCKYNVNTLHGHYIYN